MFLGRHTVSATTPIVIVDAKFDADCDIFTAATPAGFAVYQTCPLRLLRKRELTGGTLSTVVPLHSSSLLFLVGGGRSPLYPPNKVVLFDDAIGAEVAEFEFREKVRGLACRRGWLAVALRRRVVVFKVAASPLRHAEYDTCDNPRGLLAMATTADSTLLAIPGRQMGHVQLVHLPPCSPPSPIGPPPSSLPRKPPPVSTKHPVSIIAAHTTALTTLAVPPSGKLLATTSSRGTLVRVWDSVTGKLVREFRRGSDKADIYGVAFRPDEHELCVWSDKGTVHLFALVSSGASNRQSTFSPLTPFLPLPKYFDSEWSYGQYRIPVQSSHISITPSFQSADVDAPDEERCVVGWIEAPSSEPKLPVEYQLVALTYTGGWYRLSLPKPKGSTPSSSKSGDAGSLPPRTAPLQSSSGSSRIGRSDKGKDKEKEKPQKEGRDCGLEEFRRFGRWDGW